MKIVKPNSLGILQRTYTFRRQHHFAVTALGFFQLGAAAGALLTENVQWPKILPALAHGEVLDAAMPKARGEMLLAAQAHAPGGEPVRRMAVRATLGELDKQLRVSGDRRWQYGLVPLHQVTAPEPFSTMPISYDRAYGGPRYGDNPTGQGYTGRRFGAFVGENHGRMPNVEYPGATPRNHREALPPAGFGPLDLRWRQHQRKAGTYDKAWLDKVFPALPDDIDWSVFNAAAEDQQIAGFFQGGETYRLEGMHPSAAVIEGNLPALTVRAFVMRQGQTPAAAEELPMQLDTVWFFPHLDRGVCLYRGRTTVADSDALDLAAVMLGYERQGDAPRTIEHYREVLALRLDRETAAAHAFNEAQLTPLPTAAQRSARAAEQAQAEAKALAGKQERLDAIAGEFWQKSGMKPPPGFKPPQAQPSPLGVITPQAKARGDFDLSAHIEKAKALAEKTKKEGDAALQALKAGSNPLLSMAKAYSAAAPKPDVAQQKQEAEERARDGGDAAAVDAAMKGLAAAGKAVPKAAAKLPQLRHDARRLAPKVTAAAVVPEVAQHLGALVRQWLAAGESLAGRDLTGAALAGIDLRGATLDNVVLERADLSGALLNDASLNGAVLTGACLGGADLSGADLGGANFSDARAQGAMLRGARLCRGQAVRAQLAGCDLSGADLSDWLALDADLSDAVLDQTTLHNTQLVRTNLARASLKGARMDRTMVINANAEGASFAAAQIERSAFTGTRADGSDWSGARLTRVMFGNRCTLAGATLRDVYAQMCGWRGSGLKGAVLADGRFSACDFGMADLGDADLSGAVLSRAILMQAKLNDCRAPGADFFQAVCRKADFSRADLRAANFVQAELSAARFDDAQLKDMRPAPRMRNAS